MNTQTSILSKLTNIAIFSSSIILTAIISTGCSNKEHPQAPSSDVSSISKTTKVVRQLSESLDGDYAKMRANQVSDVNYQLTVNIDNKSNYFSGVSVLNFELVKDNINDLTVDFDEGTVSSLLINGKATKINYDKWFITIPAAELSSGKNIIEIAYNRPYSTDGSGFHRFVDPENREVYLYTDFEPYDANRLFPHFDQPDLKATYTLDVNAPSHWQIISATRETSITKNGDKKHWIFPQSAKFSSYVFSLHAGNYVIWEDSFEEIPLRLFARQSLAKHVDIEEWFTPTKQSFAFFNQYFGVEYPFVKYDQVIAPDFNAGAMENVAAVTFNEDYISSGEKSTLDKMELADTIAHEMAHMWFGDLVTMRWWNGLWLNESFATYMASLETHNASDFDNTWEIFYASTKQWAYGLDDSINTHAIELPVASTGDALSNFDGITYGKGASVLKQLPYYLGEDNFRTGVSNYLKKFSYKNTDLDDFMGELGKASGIDMTQWTQDWLYSAGVNTIKVDYQCANNKITQFSIKQSAPEGYPTLREQRVKIGLYNLTNNMMTLSSSTPVMYKDATTKIDDVIGKACPDLVYPNEADWGYVKVDLDDNSLDSVYKHINAIDNTTMRLMLWQSLSDSVNDANLSAEKFVAFAIANIKDEKDYNVAHKIANSLTSALYYLTKATHLKQHDYSARYREVEDLYLTLLQEAEAGSDFQKLWYQRYVRVSKNNLHLANLQNILQGEMNFDGLTIDQDKRWTLIQKINRYHYGDYKTLLSAEKAQDNSDKGVKNAIYAEVLRPEANMKDKWLKVVINNPDKLKLSTLRYVMSGLFPTEQKSLSIIYRKNIFNHIIELNKGSDLLMLEAFTAYLLPKECNAKSEQALANFMKNNTTLKQQALKRVRSSHQNIGRCIKALELLK